MTHQDRMKEVNRIGTKNVLDSIDRPIRPLIIELNRVGLATRFSCCGFPYRGEEEPKNHSRFPFVVLEPPDQSPMVIRGKVFAAFFALAKVAKANNWNLEPYGAGQWYLSCRNIVETEKYFYKKEAGQLGLHDYEIPLITMQRIANTIKQWPSAQETFQILDGNRYYAKLTDNEWQIDPKSTVTLDSESMEIINEK